MTAKTDGRRRPAFRLGVLTMLPLLAQTACDSGTEAPAASAIEIVAAANAIEVGGTLQLSATVRDETGSAIDRPVRWSTSSPTIISVTGTGLVRGLAPGAATVTAAVDGRTASQSLSVRDTAALPAQLSGELQRVRVVIPAGRTHQVTGNLTLRADRMLQIDGALELGAGAQLLLISGDSLVISGTIAPSPGTASLRGASSLISGSSAQGGDVLIVAPFVASQQNSTVFAKGSIGISGPPAANVPPGQVTRLRIAGRLYAARGQDAANSFQTGGPGHIVAIGTTRARDVIGAAAGLAVTPFAVVEIAAGGEIHGGDGGFGFSVRTPAQATDEGAQFRALGTLGGQGGHVEIEATQSIVHHGTIEAGNGGNGGDIGEYPADTLNVDPPGYFEVPDGNVPNTNKAKSLIAAAGDGGAGGSVVLTAPAVTRNGPARRGGGGVGGLIRVLGGNGGPDGDGGDFTLDPGAPGPDGSGYDPPRFSGSTGSVYLKQAARGGNGSAGGRAGAGGRVQVGPRAAGGYAAFTNVATGGTGSNGCLLQPRAPGGIGGVGGSIIVPAAVKTVATTESVNGGTGGDGNGPAPGGNGGTPPGIGNKYGRVAAPGAAGKPCPGTLSFVSPPLQLHYVFRQTVTPCPVVIATVQVRNPTNATVPYVASMDPASTDFTITPAVGEIGPGQTITLTIRYECQSNASVQTRLKVADAAGASTLDVDLVYEAPAVILDMDTGPFPAGSTILFDRITGFTLTGPEAMCSDTHLHGAIRIDGLGPYPDPRPNGCGHGKRVFVRK
jgi:hypothetical protein